MDLSIPPLGSTVPGLMGAGVATPAGEGKQLDEAVHDFVGLLYSYTFSQMRTPVDENDEGALFGGANSQMFMGFLDQEIGKRIARAEGSGLAQQMLWQMGKAKGLAKGNTP